MLVLDSASFAKSIDQKEEMSQSFKEMQNALKNTELQLDMATQNKVETVILDDEGLKIGTLGIEEVSSEPVYQKHSGDFTTMDFTIPVGVNTKYKVYWYAATVNYHFYVTVYVSSSTGLGEIVSTQDEWYLVTPPAIVNSDTVTIPNKYETSSIAAEARYTLDFSFPLNTNLWIYGKVKDGIFSTGGN